MAPQRDDYNSLAALIQATLNPLIVKLQILEDKVDKLSQDRATRSDIEKLRSELIGLFVPRDAYEPRHTALVERATQLEDMVREVRKDCEEEIKEIRNEAQRDSTRIHERLESGKQQIEDRIKQQQEAQLSTKDRAWIRWSQILGVIGIAVAALDWLSQHVHIN